MTYRVCEEEKCLGFRTLALGMFNILNAGDQCLGTASSATTPNRRMRSHNVVLEMPSNRAASPICPCACRKPRSISCFSAASRAADKDNSGFRAAPFSIRLLSGNRSAGMIHSPSASATARSNRLRNSRTSLAKHARGQLLPPTWKFRVAVHGLRQAHRKTAPSAIECPPAARAGVVRRSLQRR